MRIVSYDTIAKDVHEKSLDTCSLSDSLLISFKPKDQPPPQDSGRSLLHRSGPGTSVDQF